MKQAGAGRTRGCRRPGPITVLTSFCVAVGDGQPRAHAHIWTQLLFAANTVTIAQVEPEKFHMTVAPFSTILPYLWGRCPRSTPACGGGGLRCVSDCHLAQPG